MFQLEAIALGAYFIRDSLGGMLTYYTHAYGIQALWFLPDLAGLACVGLFVHRCVVRNQSLLALAVLLQVIVSLGIGFVFLDSGYAALSAFKMILPAFVGFCFCDEDVGSYTKLLWLTKAIFYISVIGVFLSAYTTMPWVGYSYEAFGAKRYATRLWWAASEQRLAGLAADNTAAGFFILITFVFTSIRKNVLWCIVLGSIAVYAINLTTSKTTMVVLILYLTCLLMVRTLPEQSRFPAVRLIALASFGAILLPACLIILFSGENPVHTSSFLFSMQDRINNSWQLPFVYLSQLMPIGWLTGCGLGCFNYPHNLFSPLAQYWVPVDNFYIGSYLMFGLPFVGFMWMVFRSSFALTDIYKLCSLFVMNLFSITVLIYVPSSGLLVMAIAFSKSFSLGAFKSASVHRPNHPPGRSLYASSSRVPAE